ncbi:MAG: nucleotidyl transferase AbiEii/AbiGii toxin family protein [Deltaproteobacteria bacterium]|nr:nucleotidyl transferase AbiEii/AbiGii toxin family protein [Deltaproteobacteria bacterium]
MDSKAISDSLWDLLQRLNSIPEMKYSYLAGGTALALQLEHRKSEDLDFFIVEGFDDFAFKKAIQRKALDVFVVNQTPDHLELMLQSIKVDLIRERIPLKFPLKSMTSGE